MATYILIQIRTIWQTLCNTC